MGRGILEQRRSGDCELRRRNDRRVLVQAIEGKRRPCSKGLSDGKRNAELRCYLRTGFVASSRASRIILSSPFRARCTATFVIERERSRGLEICDRRGDSTTASFRCASIGAYIAHLPSRRSAPASA